MRAFISRPDLGWRREARLIPRKVSEGRRRSAGDRATQPWASKALPLPAERARGAGRGNKCEHPRRGELGRRGPHAFLATHCSKSAGRMTAGKSAGRSDKVGLTCTKPAGTWAARQAICGSGGGWDSVLLLGSHKMRLELRDSDRINDGAIAYRVVRLRAVGMRAAGGGVGRAAPVPVRLRNRTRIETDSVRPYSRLGSTRINSDRLR